MYAKGKEMERIKQILDNRTILRALLLLTVCTSLRATSQAKGKVSFDYAKAVNNQDSQFTNTADINGDGKLDILAFKGGDGLGTWTKQIVRSDGGIYFGHLMDIDADGDLDIVGPRTYWTGPIEIWKNKISRIRRQ